MIKIAVAAALTAIVITDATIGPAATPASATIERPRGLKGDRLPLFAPNTGCADAVRPHQQGECLRVRERDETPPARTVRIVSAGQIADVRI